MSDDVFYTRVIVHAEVPAGNAGEAVGKLCDAVRSGIGPEGPAGREWGTAISASLATSRGRGDREARANEEFMHRFSEDSPEAAEKNRLSGWLSRHLGIPTKRY